MADDKEVDAFGPVARDMKIKNLQAYLLTDILCVRVLSIDKILCNFCLVCTS